MGKQFMKQTKIKAADLG